MKQFLKFSFVSGVGWVLDLATFWVLVSSAWLPLLANLASSYVGTTFVWFASLRAIFDRDTGGRKVFLLIYWTFQLISILLYSQLLQLVFHWAVTVESSSPVSEFPEMAAKIIVTPMNLITNFIFMKLLSQNMPNDLHANQ